MSLFIQENNERLRETRRVIKFNIKKTKWLAGQNPAYAVIGGLVLLSLVYLLFLGAPFSFPVGTTVTVEEGATVSDIAQMLDEENIIKSEILFKTLVRLRPGNAGVLAGDYFFVRPRTVFGVAGAISRGDFGFTPTTVTIPEGTSVVEMAVMLERRFGGFDAEHFVEIALPYEGYLFPDTYFFLPNVSEEEIVRVMREHFEEKVAEIQEEIDAFGEPLEDIVIMASLLEEEARTLESKRMISDILWSRLEIGMALQVDAVFPYIIGRNTYEVTLEDLQVDSPYNTYKYPGLPIGPITNPGLDSLLAAVTPTPNKYLFYLSDDDGRFHYAVTFDQHKINKARYLR